MASERQTGKRLLTEMRHRPLIVAVIRADTEDEFIAKVSAARGMGADLAELRIDLLRRDVRLCLPDMLQLSELPVITTARRKADGGKFEENEESERVRLAVEAMKFGTAFSDVEVDAGNRSKDVLINTAKAKGVPIIASKHESSMLSLEKIREAYVSMIPMQADITKLVFTTANQTDGSVINEASRSLKAHKKPYTLFGMGRYGMPTRVFSVLLGSALAYCSLTRDEAETGLYQVSVAEMKSIFGIFEGFYSTGTWEMVRRNPEWTFKIAEEWSQKSYDVYNDMKALADLLKNRHKTLI